MVMVRSESVEGAVDLGGGCWPRRGITRLYSAAMKTAISLPEDTFRRAERAARRLGMSRSEFFARAAERWLADLEDDATTEAIDRAIAGVGDETAFTDAAAAALASAHDQA